jgi:hypothetical protein
MDMGPYPKRKTERCATREQHGHVGEPTGASLEAETSVDSMSTVPHPMKPRI